LDFHISIHFAISPEIQHGFILSGAPLGFDFSASCLAVTPNRVFERCEGDGRLAVLLARCTDCTSEMSTKSSRKKLGNDDEVMKYA